MIEGALPIEKGTNDSWYICIAQCNVCCLFLDVDFKRSGTKPNQLLFKIQFFFAETESAWMQNRIVGRIHMAGLSHRSRSDDAAEQKFQIPKTDLNYGEKQSPNCTTDT